ncbi:acyl carrier protein [Pseudomonas aeruginosa]|nr:acyl carrier protein [Pseudomonas aeruginosa]
MDTQLEDLPEWDSLAALGVIVMFDMEYGRTITGEDLIKARTVGDLLPDARTLTMAPPR